MSSIDTLIKDITDLVENDKHIVSEESKRRLGEALADSIVRNLFTGREDQKARDALRMSSLGTDCTRQLWLKQRFPNEEKLSAPVRLKYLFGHILEELLLFLAEEAGHSVQHRQQELTLNGIVGHRDAVIDGVQTDVKSASTRGFEKFKYHKLETDDPFGYLVQNNAYWHADPSLKGDPRVAFLAIDKQFGDICLDVYPVDQSRDYGNLVEEKRRGVNGSEPPSRLYHPEPDGKSGNLKLGVQCSYCGVKNKCWPNLRTFLYSNGPRFLTHVERIPDVPEAPISR